ncbi:nucleoporin NUP42-like [Culex pipiens pallens]|uniref:nucleoporin NUP42-like n=1 Tax=Culex pipiens pallens TaxID=42434 RepID=UPI00195345C6|nr:nucleoporin NUP42-like [Culex pipiens pallens]
MVICTYYLNNNCRFGAKCNNDHIDLGAVIKSEVDVTLKGNQWPLSCFGPFKERMSVPNFIEDVCFEEVRMMYLEAKMQNNIAGHQLQLGQMITDAKQKMQWITSTNRDVMNVLIEIYNQPDDAGKAAAAGVAATANPFGAAPIGTGSTSVASSIFGGGASGGFGGSSFGGGSAASTSNIFGAAPNQTASSIFGGGTAANPAGTLGGNIFAKAAQPVAPSSNIFGQVQPQQQPQTGSVFGGAPTFGGTGGSLFASVPQPTAPIFGASVPTAAASSNPFAQPQPQAATGFGAAPPSQNLFASVAPAQPVSSNPFGGTFSAQPQPSPFGQAVPQQPQPTSGNLFLPVPTQQVAPAPVAQSPFGGAVAMPSPFGATPALAAATSAGNQFANLYSKMEDLTSEQLEAFKADRFELGKIPIVPPPKELCS